MLQVNFDLQAVEAQAAKLARLDASRVRLRAVEIVNTVALDIKARAITGATQRVNLTPSYLDEKISIDAASPGLRARAEIVARGDLTILGHYGPVQLRSSDVGPVRTRGRGQRPRGVRVEVGKGRPVAVASWFTMRLRGSGKTGVFVRQPGGLKHLYGPSPYALVRRQAEYRNEEFSQLLAQEAMAGLGGLISEAV